MTAPTLRSVRYCSVITGVASFSRPVRCSSSFLLPVGGNIAEHRRRLPFSSLRVARVEREQLVDRAVGAIVLGEVPQRGVKQYTHECHTDARTEPRGAQQLPPPLPAVVLFFPDSIGFPDRPDKAVVRQFVPTLAAGARLGAYEVLLFQNVNGGVGDCPFLTTGAFRPAVDRAARPPGGNEIAIHPQTQAVLGHACFRRGSVERVFVEPLQRFVDVAIGLDVSGRNRVDIRGKIVPELRAGDLQLHRLDGGTNGLDVLAARPSYRDRPQFFHEPLTRLGLDLSVGPREWSLDRLLGRFGAQFVEWKARAQCLRQ